MIWLEKNEKKLVVVFTALALALRVCYLLLSDNYFNGDTGTRLYMSFEWAKSPQFFEGYDWLPLHFYLLGTVIAVFHDTIWAPRILTLLIGTLSIAPFYFLVKRVFGISTAVISTLVFAVLPAHILLSVITLSEAPFVLFLLLSALFIFKYIQFQRPHHFFLAILFISCINFIRFEGWVFTALYTAVLFFNGIPLRKVVRFVLYVSIIPAFVMLASFIGTGNPLRGLLYSDFEVIESIKLYGPNIADRGRQIQMAFMALSFLFLPLGIIALTNDKRKLFYVMLFVVPLFSVLGKIFNFTLHPQFRYFISAAVLGIPFFVEGVKLLLSKIVRIKNEALVLALSAVICLGCSFSRYKLDLYDPLVCEQNGKFNKGLKESAKWVKENLKTGNLYVDDDNFIVYNWMAFAQILSEENKRLPADLSFGEFSKIFLNAHNFYHYSWAPYVFSYEDPNPIPKKVVGFYKSNVWAGDKFTEDKFYNKLLAQNVTHLVFFKNGFLTKQLKFKNEIETWRALKFRKVYDMNEYRVYQLER